MMMSLRTAICCGLAITVTAQGRGGRGNGGGGNGSGTVPGNRGGTGGDAGGDAGAGDAGATACPPEADTLVGDAAAYDYTQCPDDSILAPLSKDDAVFYDPSLVDWRSLTKAVEYLAMKEARFCNFAIRAHYHDRTSYQVVGTEAPEGIYGSDGSLLLDKFEYLQPENAYDAFAYFVRVVIKELVRFYGASFADVSNVAAFTCVSALGGVAPIPETCNDAGIGMKVGIYDASFPFSKTLARSRTDKMPGNFDETPKWMEFWINNLNEYARSDALRFTIEDSLALMGSHTLMDNWACTTDGAYSAQGAKDIGTAGCGGDKRMFQWTNAYFVDVTSGKCVPRNPASESTHWYPTSLDGAKGRAPNDQEDPKLGDCVWTSPDGQALGQQLECAVVKGAAEFGIGEIPEDADFRFVDWYPEADRYPCCGYHCQTCPGNMKPDPYYCPGSPKGTSFWAYTWQDCDLIYSVQNSASYCDRSFNNDCAAYTEPNFQSQLSKMATAYDDFSSNTNLWQEYYAYGHCKMNDLGAIYSQQANDGQGVPLVPLLGECKVVENGSCVSDPVNGVVRKPQGNCCIGTCAPLELGNIIQKKECGDAFECSADVVEAPELEDFGGEVQPGQRITKGNCQAEQCIQTTIAEIGDIE